MSNGYVHEWHEHIYVIYNVYKQLYDNPNQFKQIQTKQSHNNVFRYVTIHYININGDYDEHPFFHLKPDFQICI